MPWFSFHGGHSGEFCRHAADDLDAVVRRAYNTGFTHYGLTEHCPRYRAEDLSHNEVDLGVAGLGQLFEGYVARALALRDAYAGRMEVLVGFETERLPPGGWAERMRSLRASAPFDYVVGSVHDLDGRWVDHSPDLTRALAEDLGGTEALYVAYFGAVAELVEALKPEVVGHLDLVRKFDGDEFSFGPAAWVRIERVLEAMRAYGGVLDVNSGAYRRGLGPVYPAPSILRRAQEIGLGVTLGDDSHGVRSVGVGLEACIAAIAGAGYREVQCLTRAEGWRGVSLEALMPRPAAG